MFLITTSQIVTGIGVGLFVVLAFIFAWKIENGGEDDTKEENSENNDNKKHKGDVKK